jgi:hypothetical protein
MNDPNENLKRLLLSLYAIVQNKQATAAIKALTAFDLLLTLFLFGQDYFGWWRCPLGPAGDSILVILMTSLSVLLCGFWILICSLYFAFLSRWSQSRPATRAAQRTSRIFRMALTPLVYALPAFWGRAYLMDNDPIFWGSLAVVFGVFYQGGLFTLLVTERIKELRGGHSGTVPRSSPTSQGAVRSRVKGILWQRWWRLTHPWYLRRMSSLDRSLYGAVVRTDAHSVGTYLSRGANPNLRLLYAMPLLNLAATRGRAEIVHLLLAAGADTEATSPQTGFNPLLAAAKEGHMATARLLLEQGASVEARLGRSEATPLIMAARGGHGDMVNLLLEYAAPVNARTSNGSTALIFAALYGHAEVARILLAAGADATLKNAKGVTALEYAQKRKHRTVADILAAETTASDRL